MEDVGPSNVNQISRKYLQCVYVTLLKSRYDTVAMPRNLNSNTT